MLIISKFKDFYDAGAAYGIDKKKVFKRKQDEYSHSFNHNIDHNELFDNIYIFRDNLNLNISFLFFCGEIYPYLSICTRQKGQYQWQCQTQYHFAFNRDDIDEYFSEIKMASVSDAPWWGQIDADKEKLEKLLETAKTMAYKHFLNPCIEQSKKLNAAYFTFYAKTQTDINKIKLNIETYPKLSELRFGRILSPLETFTQIEQYLFGVLDNNPEMIEISDTDKAVAHGHDGKYSFKKTPEVKKGS